MYFLVRRWDRSENASNTNQIKRQLAFMAFLAKLEKREVVKRTVLLFF